MKKKIELKKKIIVPLNDSSTKVNRAVIVTASCDDGCPPPPPPDTGLACLWSLLCP